MSNMIKGALSADVPISKRDPNVAVDARSVATTSTRSVVGTGAQVIDMEQARSERMRPAAADHRWISLPEPEAG